MSARGVVAAGHPESAAAGAAVLREGGNAVDAAVAAVLASFAAEPLLTGLGAGGYMMVKPRSGDAVLLDFFVESGGPSREPPVAIEVDFGDAVQVFHVGAGSVGAYGNPLGLAEATRRFGTLPLADLVAPAAALARRGVELNAAQAYIFEILIPILRFTPESSAWFLPGGRLPTVGERVPLPEVADGLERLGREGAAPFYTGDIAAAAAACVADRGGALTEQDLAGYEVIDRAPIRVPYHGREILTNPPPSAGGILIALSLARLAQGASVVDALEAAQAERTDAFLEGLAEPGFADAFLRRALGSTTHVSVLDADGVACAVTSSNGEGSGLMVPGAGIHLNNMLGEEDLSPLGLGSHPPGRRLPSMMCPTIALRDGEPELVLGSAGSNRIRSAIVQAVLKMIDEGLEPQDAIDAPRLHVEAGQLFAEPGVDLSAFVAPGREPVQFRAKNLFFGGVQAVARTGDGQLRGGGDPRRGGAAVLVA